MNSKSNTSQHLEDDQIYLGIGYSSDKTLARYFDTSRSTIWLWAREGRLPQPVKLSTGSTRWSNKDINEFTKRATS
jgi:predicted DNA-binding transcriptional regulator AlpA